ncbi:DUF3037 domain-containing protein [Pseudomonas fakonensis]|uniref:DUF3037 domain-containing protein n=1 Tax=Pseudomonas fakonensis TaxID=2842355 RepID=A0ABX8N6E0_9PSED|nr:DUF3037 domain-containing protein [Pseudomonas fakonensis]QXH51862.1 DUF3037 domain-containing protein [Pseudomonas fakonensis]
MKLSTYEFAVLRYVHDRVTGEFINFGIIAYCKAKRKLLTQFKTRTARLSAVFPDMDRHHIKSVARHISSAIDIESERLQKELIFEDVTLESVIGRILKRDDSSLQWSDVSAGVTFSFEEEVDRIFHRYVTYHDSPAVRERRTEQDIWRDFEKKLKSFSAVERFAPKKISVRDDELEFKHAWKNGIWHCVEPISFDLSDADNMKDKAHRWLGQMTSIQDAREEFKLYMLVSKPQDEGLAAAFEKAVKILNKIPTNKELIFEEDASSLADAMMMRIQDHDHQGSSH